MPAHGIGTVVTRRSARKVGVGSGGRRVVSRAALAAKPRGSRVGVNVTGSRLSRVQPATESPSSSVPDVKPRRPSREMVALMSEWSPEERRAAQRAVDFIECKLRLFKGPKAGEPFRLPPWQERIIRQAFGRLRDDGTRRYRTVYIEVPRKNAKSTLIGAIGLYLLLADGEAGAEVYCAAHDRNQANIVYRSAKIMYERSRSLAGQAHPFQHVLELADGAGFLKPISADAGSQQGLDPHGCLIDELHVHPNRDLLDVLQTATGARRQPMTWMITTAGEVSEGPCWDEHQYALGVLDGTIHDDAYLAVVYAADPADDWEDPAVWTKANPNIGYSISLDYIREQCEKARSAPVFQNSFRRYHLNQWVQQETRFLPMDRWRLCLDEEINEIDLVGKPCYAGLDLSSTLDLTALVYVFPRSDGSYVVLPRHFLPSVGLADRSRRDRVQYDRWAREGLITLCEGEVIDYGWVRRQILKDKTRFEIREIAFDRWGAAKLSGELAQDGLSMIQFGQGYASMSEPTKALLSLVTSGKLLHMPNECLDWQAECVSVAQDPAGNVKPVKPDKRRHAKRIDGIVALIMGLSRAMLHSASVAAQAKARSVYETRGIAAL